MESATAWNSLEVVKILVSILTPFTVAAIGYFLNKRFRDAEKKYEQIREDAERLREEEKTRRETELRKIMEEREAQEEAREEELKRVYKPHIEFDIECNFFGPHHGKYAAEFILTANNKGATKHEFREIKLQVLGIKQDVPLCFWTERYANRLKFPEEILKDEVKPKDWNFIFVEPGIAQRLSYITMIDADIKYITAKAIFYYEAFRPHSTEKMFEISSSLK